VPARGRNRETEALGSFADTTGFSYLNEKLDFFERIHAILPLGGKLYPNLTGFFVPWEKLDSPKRHKNNKWYKP
jgi:hypothetical protein